MNPDQMPVNAERGRKLSPEDNFIEDRFTFFYLCVTAHPDKPGKLVKLIHDAKRESKAMLKRKELTKKQYVFIRIRMDKLLKSVYPVRMIHEVMDLYTEDKEKNAQRVH